MTGSICTSPIHLSALKVNSASRSLHPRKPAQMPQVCRRQICKKNLTPPRHQSDCRTLNWNKDSQQEGQKAIKQMHRTSLRPYSSHRCKACARSQQGGILRQLLCSCSLSSQVRLPHRRWAWPQFPNTCRYPGTYKFSQWALLSA